MTEGAHYAHSWPSSVSVWNVEQSHPTQGGVTCAYTMHSHEDRYTVTDIPYVLNVNVHVPFKLAVVTRMPHPSRQRATNACVTHGRISVHSDGARRHSSLVK